MCGFIGIIGQSPVAYELFTGMLSMQHRGQNSSGMLTFDEDEFFLKRKVGLVAEGFNSKNLKGLPGKIGIGHVRYPTIGSNPHRDAQPFVTYTPYGVGMAHNGNLVNFEEVKKWLYDNYQRRLRSQCDVEAIMKVFSVELFKEVHDKEFTPEKIFRAAAGTMKVLNGGYSCITLVAGKGLIGFRDPNAIRPMVFGKREKDGKKSYAFASETTVLDVLGYDVQKDLAPGEDMFIDMDLNIHSKVVSDLGKKHCMFEWVYFSNVSSFFDGKSVYLSRTKLGEELAKIETEKINKDDYVVVPVPDSAKPAGDAYAYALGLPPTEGLIRNRFIGRTFIEGKSRENKVRNKFNVQKEIVEIGRASCRERV